ncbi:MAG: class I SAM-dependent methyltransferase [Magnetococcales bacterium]|nr:class I SAM-dependent methyltransferase [Magnetococcales bacterium]
MPPAPPYVILDKNGPHPGPAPCLAQRLAAADRVLMDVGCGDARFIHRLAREEPAALCIGLDAIGAAMRPVAVKASRQPARGGAPNLILLVGDAAAPPAELTGRAEQVTVNFPWAGLLRGVTGGDPLLLAALAGLLTPRGSLEICLNLHSFQETGLRDSLALPTLDPPFLTTTLPQAYGRAGLAITTCRPLGDDPLPVGTTWGGRLGKGSRRESLLIVARPVGALTPDPLPPADRLPPPPSTSTG